MGDRADLRADEEPDFGDPEANDYASPELDYDEADAFNQSNDPPEVLHIYDHGEFICRHYEIHFPSNNKLHNHLRGSCQGLPRSSAAYKEDHEAFAFSVDINLSNISKGVEKRGSRPSTIVDISIVDSSLNPSKSIGTGYGFRGYHQLKGKVALSLSYLSDTIYFDSYII